MSRVLLLLLPIMMMAQEPVRSAFPCDETELQNAGLLCTEEEPCAIYLEINSIAAAGKNIFLAGDIHAAAATISSVLLVSQDAGATWKEPSPRIPGAAVDQIQSLDSDHIWAAGEIQYPLPRDPFFLLTTDGGASWRRDNISEDGGPGSVLRFWFDSPQHGELIVDGGRSAPGGRYSFYESETGGASWMIRSTTGQVPKIRRAPVSFDSPDFRVRPAASGKTYQVERREGDTWHPLASFVIEIASCKLKPVEPKEPTPEERPASAPKDYVEELKLGAPSSPVALPPTKTPAAPAKKGPEN